MSRTELHDWECTIKSLCGDNADKMLAIAQDIYNTAFVRGKNCISLEQAEWIPIKTRPLTEEEKEHYISIGWSEDSLEFIYNCPLPDDGQEVLITDSMGNVELDTFYSDDGCYFEDNCDADEVIAWMPKPQPYKESDKE